jgi:S-adenosylmethionine decarboxylase
VKRGGGTEWLVDASGCDPQALADREGLMDLLTSVVKALALTTVGQPCWYTFPSSGGLTGVLVLKESHITCHTYPEAGLAAFNLYVCRPKKPFPWRRELRRRLKARKVRIRRLQRSGL